MSRIKPGTRCIVVKSSYGNEGKVVLAVEQLPCGERFQRDGRKFKAPKHTVWWCESLSPGGLNSDKRRGQPAAPIAERQLAPLPDPDNVEAHDRAAGLPAPTVRELETTT